MNIETLYEMTQASAEAAKKALEAPHSGLATEPFFERYSVYPTYFSQYNRLLKAGEQSCGGEIRTLFSTLDLPSVEPFNTPGAYYKSYLELAANQLTSLAIYFKSKLPKTEKEIQSILDIITANLRASTYKEPKNEKEVQNTLETVFRARALPFEREKVTITYSSKNYIPDFTFASLDLVVETKICNRSGKEKELIDQINADIVAYQTKYTNLLFVVYDLGLIRDEAKFITDIQRNANVRVLVIKH
jgi:hypothetical protein